MIPGDGRNSASASGNGARDDPRVIAALETYFAALEAGRKLERQTFLAEHAEIAAALADCLDGLEFVHAAGAQVERGPEAASASLEPVVTGLALGDFRILREIGKGGMGVVYEAEQLSLGRRVALKVLPLAATLHPRHLQRFHNEARAAACLHHSNIVPVHAVGCERGVHFYAMQFIDGQSLDVFLRQQRNDFVCGGRGNANPAALPSTIEMRGKATTLPEPTAAAYARCVAEWGIAAAEALEHAHNLGIVHRDIKPANLLLDDRGRLWITDFGLARIGSDAGLTLTGDVLGTLRYMSPEQAMGKQGLVDPRTDVYSLGATLYELLTLHPAFDGDDRQELLRKIAIEEPTSPRRLNKAIAAELEIIVQKAMAKERGERYATAQELADDLRHWLEDRPIRARRPSLWIRLGRWSRRHKPWVVGAAAALLVGVTVLAASIGWIVRDRAARQSRIATELQSSLEKAIQFQRDGQWPQALAAAQRAERLLLDSPADPALAQQVRDLLRQLADEEADGHMIALLEELRLRQAGTDVKHNRFLLPIRVRPDYQGAFRNYGLRPEEMSPKEAAELLRARKPPVRALLLAALDHWLILARHENGAEADWLEQVLRLAEDDAWRQRLRAARQGDDRPALEQLATEVDPAAQPPEALYILRRSLCQRGAWQMALAMLRRAQEAFPGDFWINHDLGCVLMECQPPQYAEAIRFLTAAVALRPGSPGVHYNLGLALMRNRQLDEAAAAFRKAVALDAAYPEPHHQLGVVLLLQNRFEEAIAACREALRLRPKWAGTHFSLGNALHRTGRLDEAITAYRRAIELNPDFAEAHCNLGMVLQKQRKFVSALAELQKGHELGSRRPHWPYPSAQWVRDCQRLIETVSDASQKRSPDASAKRR